MGKMEVAGANASGQSEAPGSNRVFGYTFAVVFSLLTVWQAWHAHWTVASILAAVAAVFALVAVAAPNLLAPLNRIWFRFGNMLHTITNPILLGMIFFLVITPTALIMRLLKKDLLRLKFEPASKSYWIPREPPGPGADSFKNQF
jgi:hypothetical protein